MASSTDRESAKRHIASRQTTDAELEDALDSASSYSLLLEKEKNRHNETMRGHFSAFFGPKDVAPLAIAFIALVFGLLGFAYCLYHSQDTTSVAGDFWGKWAERTLGFSTSCLAYIFGKGSSKSD